MSDPALRKRLDGLKQKKLLAQRANHTAAYRAKRVASIPDQHHSPDEEDRMDWSAHQWHVYLGKEKVAPGSGFKNQSSLAHATYLKELSKMTPDLQKYERNKALDTSEADFAASKEDAEKIAQRLREASARKQSRRSGNADGGQYITEKNRQFNMKLDREYGQSN